MADVNSAFQAASQEMYNAQQQSGGGAQQPTDPFSGFNGNPGGNAGDNKSNDGGVTDVDFEEVK